MRSFWLVVVSFVVAVGGALVSRDALATPFYAIGSAHACNTCHVEPVGWHNPGTRRNRRCTLDCQGCHVSPTGGGLRTPLGDFYGREIVPMFGNRPSEHADPMRFWDGNAPTEGRYRIREGFSGWWPGPYQHRDIPDRYGNINPSPVWQVGGDYRVMAVLPTDGDENREIVAFPMEVQTYLAVHPLSNLTAYLDLGIQGSQSRTFNNPGGQEAPQWNDVLWLRELFVMVHDLPYAAWVRAGRFALGYGWRIPDHTAYMRKGMFDQNTQAYGVEAGISPNDSWANLAVYYRGIDEWPGERATQPHGVGVTGQGGIHYLGWSLGGTLHYMSGRDGASDELMLGTLWAANFHPVTYLGEIDWRRDTDPSGEARDSFFAYHELQLMQVRGFTPKLRYEWTDTDITLADDHRSRLLFGFEWSPIRALVTDIVVRREFPVGGGGASEMLIQLHGFF